MVGAVSKPKQLIERWKLLRIFPIEGQWRDIDRPDDLEAVRVFK
jgi:NDP-sugar pyrophosphorylase family protein